MRAECLVVSAIAFALLAVLPSSVLAQSAIAGVVRDTSGAVLPGVVVGAASPVLIEKMRTVVTDGEGAYRVVDLRPGLYAVTFSLPGFTSVKRDGIGQSSVVRPEPDGCEFGRTLRQPDPGLRWI